MLKGTDYLFLSIQFWATCNIVKVGNVFLYYYLHIRHHLGRERLEIEKDKQKNRHRQDAKTARGRRERKKGMDEMRTCTGRKKDENER